MMNQHPPQSPEYLAQRCLDEAGGDYTLALDRALAEPHSDVLDQVCEVLALWSTMLPVANDNEG